MKHNIATALAELAPYQEYVCYDNDYDRLTWFDDRNTITKPSKATIDAKIAELDAAEPMRQLREVRDIKLAETDWVVARATELGQPIPTEWATYRQALRDITLTATPVLNDSYYLDIQSINWPTKP
jgi:hypothetical protein